MRGVREVELTIADIAFGGKGVARDHGKVVFVPYTIEGERVAARITREKKQFAEAETTAILEPAAQRVPPRCPYFGHCGGCSYQHIGYGHQLEIKTRQVEQTLRRIGQLSDIPMRPILPSPLPYEYRNRITVHVDEHAIGFYARDSHDLIDITHCPISRPEVNRQLTELRRRRPHHGHYTLRAEDGPRIFSQTNDRVADALSDLVANFLQGGGEVLIDAYCGAGFFTQRLSPFFTSTVGIDWDIFAIEAAQRSSTGCETYIAGDVATELATMLQSVDRTRTSLVVDPPATGLTTETRQILAQFAPANLVYISCSPPTLARDLGELRSTFQIESVTPLDMFPQTAEIEVAVYLRAR